jgi:hypothetical chaperone protein
MAFGLDFGTTNSVIALARPDGSVGTVRFPLGTGDTDVFRSVLRIEDQGRGSLGWSAGPDAIAAHLDGGGEGRLIQSMKTVLSSDAFTETQVYGKRLTLEQLVAAFLRLMRRRAEAVVGPIGGRITVGRPVRFAGERPDEALAVRRLTDALAAAGFDDVAFAYEPVAAAYAYARRLEGPETILVADFGGGTTDYSLVELAPDRGAPAGIRVNVLGAAGVGVAGDALDRRIVQEVAAPALGRDRPLLKGGAVPPRWLYQHLEQWHHLSFLRAPRTMRLLDELEREASDPAPFAALRHLVEADLGFALNRSVGAAKVRLSGADAARFAFADGPVRIEAEIARAAFEAWIAPDLAAIAGRLDGFLEEVGRRPADVARVFMTGGTSLVPAVRRLFEARFGADRLVSGGELVSVGAGLALMELGRG